MTCLTSQDEQNIGTLSANINVISILALNKSENAHQRLDFFLFADNVHMYGEGPVVRRPISPTAH